MWKENPDFNIRVWNIFLQLNFFQNFPEIVIIYLFWLRKNPLKKSRFLGFSQKAKKNPGGTLKNFQIWDLSQDFFLILALFRRTLFNHHLWSVFHFHPHIQKQIYWRTFWGQLPHVIKEPHLFISHTYYVGSYNSPIACNIAGPYGTINCMPQAGFDPPVTEGPIYWMRKVDALTTQATTAGFVSGSGNIWYDSSSIKRIWYVLGSVEFSVNDASVN